MIVNGPIGPNMESVPNLVKEELKSGNEEKESNLKIKSENCNTKSCPNPGMHKIMTRYLGILTKQFKN